MSLKLPKHMRDDRHQSHKRAPKMEKELAQRIKGNPIKGSGASWVKGDVRLKGLIRIEAKTTIHKSFSVTSAMIEKLENAVFGSGEVPILMIEIEGGAKKVAVIPDWALEMIADKLGEKDEPASTPC